MLRESGCICLPSQRTLQDYTHYILARVAFSAEVGQQLIEMVDFSKEKNSYVHVTEFPLIGAVEYSWQR